MSSPVSPNPPRSSSLQPSPISPSVKTTFAGFGADSFVSPRTPRLRPCLSQIQTSAGQNIEGTRRSSTQMVIDTPLSLYADVHDQHLTVVRVTSTRTYSPLTPPELDGRKSRLSFRRKKCQNLMSINTILNSPHKGQEFDRSHLAHMTSASATTDKSTGVLAEQTHSFAAFETTIGPPTMMLLAQVAATVLDAPNTAKRMERKRSHELLLSPYQAGGTTETHSNRPRTAKETFQSLDCSANKGQVTKLPKSIAKAKSRRNGTPLYQPWKRSSAPPAIKDNATAVASTDQGTGDLQKQHNTATNPLPSLPVPVQQSKSTPQFQLRAYRPDLTSVHTQAATKLNYNILPKQIRHLYRSIDHLRTRLVPLIAVDTGLPHPNFPRSILQYHILTHAQLDSLARWYHQTFDAGPLRWMYPASIEKAWTYTHTHMHERYTTEADSNRHNNDGTAEGQSSNVADDHEGEDNANREVHVCLATKRRRFGRFIGLQGCESPLGSIFPPNPRPDSDSDSDSDSNSDSNTNANINPGPYATSQARDPDTIEKAEIQDGTRQKTKSQTETQMELEIQTQTQTDPEKQRKENEESFTDKMDREWKKALARAEEEQKLREKIYRGYYW